MDNNLSFVRTEMLQGQTPPLGERGIVRWMRTNLFATPAGYGSDAPGNPGARLVSAGYD